MERSGCNQRSGVEQRRNCQLSARAERDEPRNETKSLDEDICIDVLYKVSFGSCECQQSTEKCLKCGRN